MRLVTFLPLLFVPAALLVVACDDSPSPHEPPAVEEDVPMLKERPVPEGGAPLLVNGTRWGDGYLLANDPLAPSYRPAANASFNRSGGAITLTKPAGTTGRYIATFRGLSALLGGRSTVHVTGFGTNKTYCKPVTGYLVSDKVEVRCYKGGTGTAVNAAFSLLVTRDYADRAFALAHQPTATGYSPKAQASWNPAGTIQVNRMEKGVYEVIFTNLRSAPQLPAHAQVNAVGSGKAHCTLSEWGGEPDLYVHVSCYTPAGALVDSKFSVLFTKPADHLAYAWADQPTTASYSPAAFGTWNPSGGRVAITRSGVGKYTVWWVGVDPEILGRGNVQVTAVAYGAGTQCKVTGQGTETAQVQCFAPNGTLVDSYYSVMLGS
jgi:hypothetical protein